VANIYDKMQGTATTLLRKYNQGVIRHWRAGANTGTAFNPIEGTPTLTTINAVAKGVEQKYLADGYISASDIQVTSAVFGIEPTLSDKIEMNNKLHEIVSIKRIPASGSVIAWLIFVKS
jgi:hypothetical protein